MPAAEPIKAALGSATQIAEQAVAGPARFQVILVLAGVFALDAADKATISAVADGLKHAFGIGNTEIGLLISSVSFVGAVFAFPAGLLVDRTRRKPILMTAVAVWSVAMVIGGTAGSFGYLLASRIFLGAVTATAAPVVASLTGDFFPARERAHIYGMILAGELVGMGFGFLVAGEVSSWAGWRWPFYLMAVPGAVLVWAIWRFLPEPARGGQSHILPGQQEVRSERDVRRDDRQPDHRGEDEQPESATAALDAVRKSGAEPRPELILHEDPTERSLVWAVRYVLRIPTYRLLVVASALGYFFVAGIRGFAIIYFTQHYGISRSAFSALVVVIGGGALAGVVMGGRLSERLLARGRPAARIVVPGIALLLAVVLFAPAILIRNAPFGIALLTLGGAALAAANPPIDAARLDIVHPRLWGRAEAGRTAFRSTLEGIAPLLFGVMSDWLGGGDAGLQWACLVMLLPLLMAASLAIPARRVYPRDVATNAASIERTAR